MRKTVSHLIMTLDGVVKFEAVMETIARLRDQEVQADFFLPGWPRKTPCCSGGSLTRNGRTIAILDP